MSATMEAPSTDALPDIFPLDSFRESARHLRRPFTARAVKFKVQTDWAGGGMIVAYIDARLVVERLNLVCPHLWRDEYAPIDETGARLACRLTVDDITRIDIGEGYKGKGLYSDALKRAGVKFGIGVSLYAIPRMYLKVDDGDLKQKTVREKLRTELTAKGERHCRELYSAWLESEGISRFGDPLDHGDSEDSVGDVDATPVAPDEDLHEIETVSAEEVAGLLERFQAIGGDDELKRGLKIKLGSLGVSGESVGKALAKLTPAQLPEVNQWLSDEADRRAS